MASDLKVGKVLTALSERRFPSITMWNRLEGQTRTLKFERALKAEVHDALWMLSKQWQMGEFRGSDTASPVFAKLQVETTRLTKYRPDAAHTQAFETEVPLQAKVERRPVPLNSEGNEIALDLRLLMGRQWLKLVAPIGPYRQLFTDKYPVQPPAAAATDASRSAHAEVRQMYAAVGGRAMDGGALYTHLSNNPTHRPYDGLPLIATADHPALDDAAKHFLAWYRRLISQPPFNGDDAWLPERLEYQFAVSAPQPHGTEKIYSADEYHQGRLDWYSLDVDQTGPPLEPIAGSETTGLPAATPRTTIPIPVSFTGMPNTRWWTFEDQQTNFGDVDAATTDLAKLLFLEFALVYANDWFLIPYTLPAGSIATLTGLVVTNVFGERFWIEAAGSGQDDDWQRWSMFTVNVDSAQPVSADTSLLLLPTVANTLESAPTEEVTLIRDEIANMVWAVERTVPLATGESKPGAEAARETLAYVRSLLEPPPTPTPSVEPAAPIRYRVMSTVPENWIPLIPVHIKNNTREIQLQRAAMPRIIEGEPDPPAKIRPRTRLMRHGLDRSPPQPYFVHEEEVTRAGTRISSHFVRTRWTDGAVHLWLRARKQVGRGEGSSGLRFDYLKDTPPSQ